MPWRWPWTRTHDRALWQVGDLPMQPTASGEPVTADRALRLSTVWGCVRLLADSVSTLPLHVYRGDERDPIPTPPLLARPSADFPEFSDWCWAVMASLLTRGNAWGVITDRAGAGLLPAQVDLVDPDQVAVSEEDGQWVVRIGGQEVDRSELWHVRAYPRAGALEGMSPIGYAREAIGLGIAAERYGARFFSAADLPAGFLETDQKVDQEVADNLRARWKQLGRGQREIAVLGSGTRFKPLAIAPEESQFIETQRFSVATICRLYGIAPEMMGGETAGHEAYTSPEMRGVDFLTFTLRPWLLRVERAISTLLPRTQAAKFNAGGFVRATLRERYEAHAVAIASGFLTVNEVRALEDRAPLQEGGAVA